MTNQKAADSSRSSLAIKGTLFSKRSFGGKMDGQARAEERVEPERACLTTV